MKKPETERDTRIVRVDNSILDDIDDIIKRNPIFKIPSDVIRYSIDLFLEIESKKK